MAANVSLILLITQKGEGERETNKYTRVDKRNREREREGQRERESARERESE